MIPSSSSLSFAAAFLSTALLMSAADWHVAPGGSDGGAGSAAAPFATISRAATVAQPGDTVWIAPGTYRETVRPANSGTAGSPIVFRGSGGRPRLSGADLVGGPWTRVGTSAVYWAPWVGDYVSSVNQSDQIFVDGTMIELLRWPKDTARNPTKPVQAAVDSVTFAFPESTVNDAAFDQPDGRWTGAKVWVNLSNEYDGQGQSGRVLSTNLASRQIRWTGIDTRGGAGAWGVRAGTAYHLFDPTPEGLAASGGVEAALGEGEWWLDRGARRIYVRLAGGSDPAGRVIEAKRRDWGFDLVDRSHVVIRDLELFATSLTTDPSPTNGQTLPPGTTRVANSTGIVLDGLRVSYVSHFVDQSGDYQFQWASQSGLLLNGRRHVLRNSEFRWGAGSAVSLLGHEHRVYNNLFENLGYQVTEAGVLNTGKANATSQDFKIAYNTARESAGLGFSIRVLKNSDPTRVGLARIHHNHLYGLMQRVHDAAAIDWVGTDGQWIRIDHNLIHGHPRFLHFGIYPDYGVGGDNGRMRYQIDHNVVFDTWSPIGGNAFTELRIFNNVALASPEPNTGSTRPGINTQNGTRDNREVDLYNNIASGTLETLGRARQGANLTGSVASLSPLFANAGASDPLQRSYALASAAAAAINQGVVVPPWDDPVEGSAPDIGAYESGRAPWVAGRGAIPWYLDDEDSLRVTARGAVASGTLTLHPFASYAAVTGLRVVGTSAGVTATLASTSVAPDQRVGLSLGAAAAAPLGSGWVEIEGTLEGGQAHRQVITFAVLETQTVARVSFAGGSGTPWRFDPASSNAIGATAWDTEGRPLAAPPAFSWAVTGGGTISGAGELTASSRLGGPYAVIATADGVSGIQLFRVSPDWARRGTLSASSELNASTGRANAVDASLTTLWVSGDGDPQWLAWDFGEAVHVDSLNLLWHPANFASSYAIEVSADGQTWQRILDSSGHTSGGERQHALVDAPAGRHLRVLGLSRPTSSTRYGVYDVRMTGVRPADRPTTVHTVTTAATNGSVVRVPEKASYAPDERVLLRAVPATGYRFVRWEGDATGSAADTLVPTDRNRTVTALFEVVPASYSLTVTAGGGTVTRSPDKPTYGPGESVTLRATPSAGYVFGGWSGDASGGTGEVTVVMDRNRAVVATFLATYSLTVSSAYGQVVRSPDKAVYTAGETVTLTATPSAGYRFFRWSGGATGTLPAVTVLMDRNRAVTAEYHAVVDVGADTRATGASRAVAVAGAPRTDGRLDAIWGSAPRMPIELPVKGTAATSLNGAADLSANWSAAWDAQALYVLIVVTDDRVGRYSGEPGAGPSWWTDDSVEIYLDPDLSRGASYDRVNDLQLGIRPTDPSDVVYYGANSVRPLAGVRTASAITAVGYVMEVSLPWTSLGVDPGRIASLGIEVAVNDGDVNGGTWPPARLGWASANGDASERPSVFGTLPLSPPGGVALMLLKNLSARTVVGAAADTLITGFVIRGAGKTRVLARGVGPSLGAFGVAGVLADPRLSLYRGGELLGRNLSWTENRAVLEREFAAVGAFPLSSERDSAALFELEAGGYTLHLESSDGTEGVALVELYRLGEEPDRGLVNLSARARVGVGERVMIPGFVIAGTGSMEVLVRGVGPGLAGFGVDGVLGDPVIELYDSVGRLVATNDDWGSAQNAAALAARAAEAGAFALGVASADAAILVSLAPGSYTAVIRGKSAATGVALLEVYPLAVAR